MGISANEAVDTILYSGRLNAKRLIAAPDANAMRFSIVRCTVIPLFCRNRVSANQPLPKVD